MLDKLKRGFRGIDSVLRSAADPGKNLREEQVFARVLREMENGVRRDGIWAIALAEADFDESKAKAVYLKRRAQSIIDEESLQKTNHLAVQNEIPKVGLSDVVQDKTLQKHGCKKCGYHGHLRAVWNTGWFTGHYTISCPICKDVFKALD